MKHRHVLILGSVFAIILAAAWLISAAPISPHASKLTEDMRSLAGLERVRIDVAPINTALVTSGLEREKVLNAFRARLLDVGLKVGDDDDLPKLMLVFTVGEDASQPGALAVSTGIAMRQRVVVERLDRNMELPTFILLKTVLTTRDKAEAIIDREVRSMVRQLRTIINRATTELKTQGSSG